MKKIVTFGEIMLRLSPENGYRLFQGGVMKTCFGGSEANVAALCAQLGVRASFVTKLPEGPAGDGAVRFLSGYRPAYMQEMAGDRCIGYVFCFVLN